jgi:ADP-heptose:LPS heptosyltransferase
MMRKAIEKKGKRLIMAALRLILGARPASAEQISPRRLRRILVVRQDERLGNLLLITPLFEALRKHLPRARITALVSRRFGDVLRCNPDIDEILSFDKRRLLRNPFRLISLVRTLRKRSFELAIDCGPVDDVSLNNSLWTLLSGAALRLGHLRGDSHLFLNILVPTTGSERWEVDHHLDLLRHLFGEVPAGRVKIALSDQERQGALRRWRQWGFGDDEVAVALHIGGRGRKQWGIDRFLALARNVISQHGVKVLLFWGPNEGELIRQLDEGPLPGLHLVPPLPVRELAAQLERCRVFVGNDSGPMHLAVAVGTPTVAIFLKPNYPRYGPRGRHDRIVHQYGGDVTVGDVLAAVGECLRARRTN